MRQHGRRLCAVIVVCAGLTLGSLPSIASAGTPDGEPAPGFVTWGGDTHLEIPAVTKLPTGTTLTDLAAGSDFLVGLLSDGTVDTWGGEHHLGGLNNWARNGLAGTKATKIAASFDDAMVLTEDGDLRSYGIDTGTTHDLDVPAALDGKTVVDFGLTQRAVAALTSDGKVVAWGHVNTPNDHNGYGNITEVPSSVADATVTDLDVGTEGRAVALLASGEVVEWGLNAADFPAAPAGDPYTQVSIGLCDTLAVTASGKVVQRAVCPFDPVPASLDDKVVTKVDTEGANALALTADHEVVHWGHLDYPEPMPASMTGRTATAIAVGGNWQSVAVLDQFSAASAAVAGQPIVGRTLTASSASAPTAASTTYKWMRDGTPIAGSTGPTYTLTTQDRGHRVSAVATMSTSLYDDASVQSARTAVVRLPAKTFHVDVSRYEVRRTHSFTVAASGLASSEAYTIRLAGKPVTTGHASKTGRLSRVITMPATLGLTRHRVDVVGWQADRSGGRAVRTLRR